MSIWNMILLGLAVYALIGPFIAGMHAALIRGLGMSAGLLFGLRRFQRKAMGYTLCFLPATLCMGIVIGMAALPVYLGHLILGAASPGVPLGMLGFCAGVVVALRNANHIAGFIMDRVPNKDQVPCPLCYRYREHDNSGPCFECGEPAPQPDAEDSVFVVEREADHVGREAGREKELG